MEDPGPMRLLGPALALAVVGGLFAAPQPAAASPKGYDIEHLLRQGLPQWRLEEAAPAPETAPRPAPGPAPALAPIVRPLERLPNVPAPAYVPAPGGSGDLTAPPPLPADAPPPPDRAAAGDRAVIQAPGAPRSTTAGAWRAPR